MVHNYTAITQGRIPPYCTVVRGNALRSLLRSDSSENALELLLERIRGFQGEQRAADVLGGRDPWRLLVCSGGAVPPAADHPLVPGLCRFMDEGEDQTRSH